MVMLKGNQRTSDKNFDTIRLSYSKQEVDTFHLHIFKEELNCLLHSLLFNNNRSKGLTFLLLSRVQIVHKFEYMMPSFENKIRFCI